MRYQFLSACLAFLLIVSCASPALSENGSISISPPLEVAGYDFGYTNLSKFQISSVDYKFSSSSSDRVNLTITLNGKKNYDADGDLNIRFSNIRVKIRHERGIWNDSANISTGGSWVGNSLFFASYTFYSIPSGVYYLEFRDALSGSYFSYSIPRQSGIISPTVIPPSPMPTSSPSPSLLPTTSPAPMITSQPVTPVAPEYIISDMSYDGKQVMGSVALLNDTMEAENLHVRVTFYLEGNYYMATVAQVENGVFAVEGVGPINYISAVVQGNSLDGALQRYGAKELYVN